MIAHTLCHRTVPYQTIGDGCLERDWNQNEDPDIDSDPDTDFFLEGLPLPASQL